MEDDRAVIYSQNEEELSARDAKQIRMNKEGEVKGLEINAFYAEMLTPKKEGDKIIHEGGLVKKFQFLGMENNHWAKILVQGQSEATIVSLADLGVLPYQEVVRDCVHYRVFRLNHYIIPSN